MLRVKSFGRSIFLHTLTATVTRSSAFILTHLHYKERSPYYYIQTAERRSAVLCQFFKLIFEQTQTPETVYRRCDGLLSLQRQTNPLIFERACQRAINNNILSYKFVENVIKNKTYLVNEIDFQEYEKPLSKHVIDLATCSYVRKGEAIP
jgi:hypothetical protein